MLPKVDFCAVIITGLIVLLILAGFPYYTAGQDANDTLNIKGGSYMIINNSLVFFPRDTVVIISQKKITGKISNHKGEDFYLQLHQKASGNRLSKELYNLIFRYRPIESSPELQKSHSGAETFFPWQGKTIGRIDLFQPEVFGKRYDDSLSVFSENLTNIVNRLHINTRKSIIYNNLLFHTGDTVDAFELADNEIILRKLPYIGEAKIIVSPSLTDTNVVDITVIAKDVWSAGAEMMINDPTKGFIDIFDKNLLGFGHLQENRIYFDTKSNPSWGYEGLYRINNFRSSFVNTRIGFYSFGYDQHWLFQAQRDFITPETRYAGGLSLINGQKIIEQDDTINQPHSKITSSTIDVWAGRSFKIFRINLPGTSRPQVVAKMRFTQLHHGERPLVAPDSNLQYLNYNRFLFSLGYRQQRYIQNNYILKFGPTEDFTSGLSVEYTGGYQEDDLGSQWYSALAAEGAHFINAAGYFSLHSSLSAWMAEKQTHQVITQTGIQYFSPLIYLGTSKLRLFGQCRYTHGKKLNKDERLTINNYSGIRDFTADSLYGKKRFTFRFENVIFPKLYIYGFGTAVFVFYDGAFLSSQTLFLPENYYSAIGFGLRIRNENLVFNSFEIRLAYYPRTPSGIAPVSAYLSNEYSLGFSDFSSSWPEIQVFR